MDVNRRFYQLIRIFAAAWVLSVAVFWLFCRDPQMAMLHVIVVQYLFLPALTVLLSFSWAERDCPSHRPDMCCWASPPHICCAVCSPCPCWNISSLAAPRCRAGTISLRFCSFLPLGCWSVWYRRRSIFLDVPQKLHHISLTIGPAICPGKNAPGALARNPRRRHRTAPAEIFANPGPSGPAGI